ncbi:MULTISPECIES: substrate-binding domain-containing protein [Nocardia]|uniref:substrate-binding domain-containing protein n=1 Tax=Nocardia TaxID=1817 RepID=UPI000AF774FA|nr:MULTISPECIES: substrate-binding domain-containing protein [Nocardia]MBF6275228.1 VWA domain-containing protein [Nocardia nova]
MGTHRSADGSRGVSKGLVITVVAVLLLIVAVAGWFWLSNRSASENRSAAGQCIEGPVTLAVTVDPDIAAPVRAAADRYNATHPQIRDHCAKVSVTERTTAAMVTGLTAPNWDAKLGPQPGLWIPSSSRAVEQMRVPGLVQGTPASIAVSPIAVAAPGTLAQAMEKANLSWSDLARLQRGSLGDIGLGSWGPLRMAMPPGDDSLAAAVAVGSAVSGSDPLTDESAASGQVIAAISGLAADAPESGDTASALAAVADSAQGPNSPIHAVAVTEQQAKTRPSVALFHPTGAAPVADHPAAMLTGSWVDKTQNLAAGMFADFLRAPEQQKLFTDNGFGAAAATPTAVPAKSVLDRVQSVLAHPVLGVQATILIDTSASMAPSDGSMSRLNNALAAVQSTLDTMPPDFGAGAWIYANQLTDGNPYRMVAPTQALTPQHRSELSTALGNVTLAGSSTDRTYPSLEAAYRSAVKNYSPGKTNSVLLITGGPNDNSSVTGDQLITDITGVADAAHPVRVDVIVVGGQGAQTLQNLAQKTGGTYTKVSTSDDMTFGTAVNHALTTP